MYFRVRLEKRHPVSDSKAKRHTLISGTSPYGTYMVLLLPVKFNFYAFLPFSLIGMMLHKIQREEATGICIIPLWPTQPWFSHMLRLLIEIPVILPQRMDLLYLPHHSPRNYHPLLPKLRLIACKLSGMPSASSRFLDMLPRQSLVAGDHLRGNSISQQLGSGYTSVLRGKLIHFKQLLVKE